MLVDLFATSSPTKYGMTQSPVRVDRVIEGRRMPRGYLSA